MATEVLAVTKCEVTKSSMSLLEKSRAETTTEVEDGEDAPPFVPPPSSWFENLNDESSDNSHILGTNHSDDASLLEEGAHPSSPHFPTSPIMSISSHPSLSSSPTLTSRGGVPLNPRQFEPPEEVGNTHPSPSWKEISSQVLPAAARELLSSSWRRIYYTARLSYAKGRWQRKYSDIGNNMGGIYLGSNINASSSAFVTDVKLPHFSSLSWVDRQLVREWRTYLPSDDDVAESPKEGATEEDFDFDRARALVPNPFPRPYWQKTDVCYACKQTFGPTRLRHHCRMCGHSFCQPHSSSTHKLPHLGYDPEVPERVCDNCKRTLTDQNLAERVAWRLARCRDFTEGHLTPYFEMGLDTASEVALRITRAAIAMAKSIPLGAQASVAVETVDVLRKYGLNGIYGIMLRQEFLAAADLLQRALGINKASWPLSVHELSAAIFYALAQHRAMRGLNPDREEIIHTLRSPSQRNQQQQQHQLLPSNVTSPWTANSLGDTPTHNVRTTVPSVIDNFAVSALSFHNNPVIDQTDTYHPETATYPTLNETFDANVHDPRQCETPTHTATSPQDHPNFVPVCDPISDSVISSLIFYAPIALNFIYAEKEVDMQLLAAQQGWRLLYAFMDQELNAEKCGDRPGSAMFLHQEFKIACLSIRGTATIQDVVTDIRQIPVPFPDQDFDASAPTPPSKEEEWTSIFNGQGLALCGMASAAVNLFREHIDSIMYFAKRGYRIRITGHSLGGGVAAMVGVLVLRHLERDKDLARGLHPSGGNSLDENVLLRVYAYGAPSCMDAKLAASVEGFVTSVVLHDDAVPRLTPTSCRGLLKHLLYIRETWVKVHIEEDLRAVGERAKTVWAPKFRQSFTLAAASSSSASIKKYCKKQFRKGKKLIASQGLRDFGGSNKKSGKVETKKHSYAELKSQEVSDGDWGERFFVPGGSRAVSRSLDPTIEETNDETVDTEETKDTQSHLLLEFLGGVDNQTVGIVIDGDEFFDTENKLVESDDDDTVTTDCFRDPLLPQEEPLHVSDSWSFSSEQKPLSAEPNTSSNESSNDGSDSAAVFLEETPLPRMFVPGKIAHVYSHRGVYKAAYVPRTFRELRRISLAGNMLTNHGTKGYYEGLLEVQTARAAPERPPRWTAFDEDDTCCCCANRFTWASTSDSEAQEARDKHNCRSCGGLVCDPCAKNRAPIPSIGLTVAVRVCDRCYNDMGGHSVASSSLTSSFLAVDEEDHHLRDDYSSSPGRVTGQYFESEFKAEERPERKRERRSAVVDELANQIRSSALTSHAGEN